MNAKAPSKFKFTRRLAYRERRSASALYGDAGAHVLRTEPRSRRKPALAQPFQPYPQLLVGFATQSSRRPTDRGQGDGMEERADRRISLEKVEGDRAGPWVY